MELGEALKYFFSKAEIIINHSDFISINLLSCFPLLKSGYGLMDTTKNIFSLYIKINKLNRDNKIIVDNLFIEAFNGSLSVSNCDILNNKYIRLINLYEYIIKYQKFEHINLLKPPNYLDPINCPEPFKEQYNNLVKAVNEHNTSNPKNLSSIKEIYIKNYKEFDVKINTFDFLKYSYENFNYEILDLYNIKDIIDLNVKEPSNELEITENMVKELTLSQELIKILRTIEQDNVFEAAIIRNNNTPIKILEHNFTDLNMILKIANYNNCKHTLKNILTNNYLKLLNAIICNDNKKVYKYLYESNIDPRGYNNNLYHLSQNDRIKEMIRDVSIKKNLLQKEVISNKINEIIGIGYGDLSNTLNFYINKNLL